MVLRPARAADVGCDASECDGDVDDGAGVEGCTVQWFAEV
jgi:hypothetical protein